MGVPLTTQHSGTWCDNASNRPSKELRGWTGSFLSRIHLQDGAGIVLDPDDAFEVDWLPDQLR